MIAGPIAAAIVVDLVRLARRPTSPKPEIHTFLSTQTTKKNPAKMQYYALLAALLASSANAQTMLRFACSQLVVDRVDPLVNPGVRYTPHLHQIVGGNSFNLTMEPAKYDMAARSTCTSCSFKEDLSNYWTAVMFFKARNGTYKRIPQVGNGGPQGQLVNKGGLDVYYIPSGKVTAFAPGFRMVAGDAANTAANKVAKGNICHRCWKSTNDNQFTGGAPCTGADTVDIPYDTSCKMIRQTIIFPQYVLPLFFFRVSRGSAPDSGPRPLLRSVETKLDGSNLERSGNRKSGVRWPRQTRRLAATDANHAKTAAGTARTSTLPTTSRTCRTAVAPARRAAATARRRTPSRCRRSCTS